MTVRKTEWVISLGSTGGLSPAHMPGTSAWWFNSKLNLIERRWIYHLGQQLWLSVRDAKHFGKNSVYGGFNEGRKQACEASLQAFDTGWGCIRKRAAKRSVWIHTVTYSPDRWVTRDRESAGAQHKLSLVIICLPYFTRKLVPLQNHVSSRLVPGGEWQNWKNKQQWRVVQSSYVASASTSVSVNINVLQVFVSAKVRFTDESIHLDVFQ